MVHIQYPVGQGGLHLGIIGTVAYIYDCGGKGKNVDWQGIFDDVYKRIKQARVYVVHIYISHWHQDHCNQLNNFSNYLNAHGFFDKTTPRKKNIFEQISYLCEYDGDNDDYKHYYDVITGKNFQQHMVFIDKEHSNEILYAEWNNPEFLRTFALSYSEKTFTRIEQQLMGFCSKLCDGSTTDLLRQMQHIVVHDIVKTHYFYIKHINRYTNHKNMLCLYCNTGCHSNQNCLHTGDATMRNKAYINQMKLFYGNKLKDVNFVQIPHHASRYNHHKDFIHIFHSRNLRALYYTIGGGTAKPHTIDIGLPASQIKIVSDNPTSKFIC